MVKQFLLIIGFLFSIQVMSQTGIGTATPHASAKLEVSSTDKGFLPPRVILTSTNSASPITSPANGLMVFNTATAGVNPYQVVPGYYYWDGTGQQWVSLSTTVGNVQNQAIFRSTSSTTGTSVVTSWNSRFNNIANGDLTFSSNTTFALSNGIYKIQWGLPHQSTQTYNMMQLQENISGSWGAWLNDANFANVANGGNTDWGGTSFMTDVIDCSSSTRTLRFTNPDGRTLLTGASFIITKLNPAITTSTTADNFGNHTATKNLLLNGNYLSNDGGNEGISVDNSGNVGIGTSSPNASAILDITSTTKGITFPRMTSTQRNAIASPTNGLQVFDITTNSICYYDGTSWVNTVSVASFGDIKTGIQSGDHSGWIKLDGRAKSTLTSTQQAQATALGIGTTLPDATNAFLVQNNATLGNVSGSNSVTIAQNQLPNITFTGSIISVAHGASVAASASGVFSRVSAGSTGNATGGGITNTFNLNIPLNGGVTQTALDITPKSLSVNTFIYLGN